MKSSTAYPRSSSQFRSGSANEELLTRRRARVSVAIYDVVQLVLHPEPSVTRLRALQASGGESVSDRCIWRQLGGVEGVGDGGLGCERLRAPRDAGWSNARITGPLPKLGIWSSCSIRRKWLLSL